GRISSFAESGDGRYLITLTGVIRFKISKELDPLSYRRVTPDFRAFAEDLEEASVYVDRPHLLSALKSYFKTQDIEADWNAIEQTEDERLVTAIAMLCPLDTSEKQLLLEADSLTKRAEILIAILEMGSRKGEDGNAFH
ncbi:MAG: LON peptidase substrate-binding domain-containing protein, partial [Kiloniellales bacterium]|nr:LON peptidase substrate-binding domain-containing protein [Kiloniellales bacterium]